MKNVVFETCVNNQTEDTLQFEEEAERELLLFKVLQYLMMFYNIIHKHFNNNNDKKKKKKLTA